MVKSLTIGVGAHNLVLYKFLGTILVVAYRLKLKNPFKSMYLILLLIG